MNITGFTYSPYDVRKVNEAEQWIEVWSVLYYRWKDPHLSWNPAEYGGTEEVFIPTEKVWHPIFEFTQAADQAADQAASQVNIPDELSLHYTGYINVNSVSVSKTIYFSSV